MHLLERKDGHDNFLYQPRERERLSRERERNLPDTFGPQPQMEMADYFTRRNISRLWAASADNAFVGEEAIERKKVFSKVNLATFKETSEQVAWDEMSETEREEWRLMQAIQNSVQWKFEELGMAVEELTELEKEKWIKMQKDQRAKIRARDMSANGVL